MNSLVGIVIMFLILIVLALSGGGFVAIFHFLETFCFFNYFWFVFCYYYAVLLSF